MPNRSIVARTYFDIKIFLASPVNIGNGVSEDTDADVMRNSAGECFIPGTSLAGAFRNYLGDEKNEESIFGYSEGEAGQMSSVFISDMYFDRETVKLSIRDRVSLKDDKDVDNKFDVEIIEPGASGTIRIETIRREGDSDPNEQIGEIILAISDGDIRFGAIKNRGFGRAEAVSVRESKFSAAEMEEWIRFLDGEEDVCGTTQSFAEWKSTKTRSSMRYSKHSLPLTLTGGISIRRYSAQPGKADFEHITSNGKPIIPGTSWNGAIRADAKQILKDFGLKETDAESLIGEWFGPVKKNGNGENEDDSRQSMIVIGESVIRGAKSLPMTRNNINRFTAGTKDGALYTELSYIGGETELEYMIAIPGDEPTSQKMKALEGMMKLVTRDICLGLVAVGGQVSVGRGIFRGEAEDLRAGDESLNALYQEVRKYVDSRA